MEIDCSNTIIGNIFSKYINDRIEFDFINRNHNNKRLISQYNRSPSIFKGSLLDEAKNSLRFDVSTLYKSLIHNIQNSKDGNDKVKYNIPIYEVLHKVICLTGAGISMVGIGLLSLFGVCAAASTACSITMCNKYIENNPTYDCTRLEYPEIQKFNPIPAIPVHNDYKPMYITKYR